MSAASDKTSLKPAQPFRVFISYAREDTKHLLLFEKHLRILVQQGWIDPWTDRLFKAGDEWEDTLLDKLRTSDVVILLVSADFNASDYIQDEELPLILERQQQNKVSVIPILVRPVQLGGSPLARLQGLPLNRLRRLKAVTTWKNQDSAWVAVEAGLRKRLKYLLSKQPNVAVNALATPEQITPAPLLTPSAPHMSSPPHRRVWGVGAILALLTFGGFGWYFGFHREAASSSDFSAECGVEVKPHTATAGESPSSTMELVDALPLTLVWLEDDTSQIGAPGDVEKLREYVAKVLRVLSKARVHSVVIDLGFTTNGGEAGKQALAEALVAFHSTPGAVPVYSLAPLNLASEDLLNQRADSPLLPMCGPTEVKGCFDALLRADVLPEGNSAFVHDELQLCPSGQTDLITGLVLLLQAAATGVPADPMLLECSTSRLKVALPLDSEGGILAHQKPFRERDSSKLLEKCEHTGVLSGLAGQVILIGDGREGDHHRLRDVGSGIAARESLPGAAIDAWAAQSLCAQDYPEHSCKAKKEPVQKTE